MPCIAWFPMSDRLSMHHPLNPCDRAARTDGPFRTHWRALVQDYVRPGGPGQWVFIVAWILSLVRQWLLCLGVAWPWHSAGCTRPASACAWLVLESPQRVPRVSCHGYMWPLTASPPRLQVALIAIMCSSTLRRKHPYNILALFAFTCIMSVLVGTICRQVWEHVQASSWRQVPRTSGWGACSLGQCGALLVAPCINTLTAPHPCLLQLLGRVGGAHRNCYHHSSCCGTDSCGRIWEGGAQLPDT